jgi:hypothetical protein
MKLERDGAKVVLTLDPDEVPFLRHAVERALLIDIPVSAQPRVAGFAGRLLDALNALK